MISVTDGFFGKDKKKEFLRVFVGRIKIFPGKGRGTVEYYKIPDLERLLAGNSSFKLVAGVGFEPTTFGL